jgi:four helix bundle protein
MAINSFEDLEVYKKTREFRKEIYNLIRELPKDEKINLCLQMRRAATSITNNIAEGFGRYHFQENIQFCRQARGSINELIDDLNVCLDENYINKEKIDVLKIKAYELIKILNGYIAHPKRSKNSITQ